MSGSIGVSYSIPFHQHVRIMKALLLPFIRIYGRIEEIIFLRYVSELSLLDFAPKECFCSTKIDDSYPLTELEDFRTKDQIRGPDSRTGSLFGVQVTDIVAEIHPQSTIKGRQGWEVRWDEGSRGTEERRLLQTFLVPCSNGNPSQSNHGGRSLRANCFG